MTELYHDAAADGGPIGVVDIPHPLPVPDNPSPPDGRVSGALTALGFAAGTRILTTRGEVAVEELTQDDVVVGMRRGKLARVRRVSHREVAPASHTDPDAIAPVRIRADAFGPGRPHCDLVLSPNHALYVDGQLIAVRHLRNGATICQERRDRVAYYHVAVDAHDILLANGMTAESVRDAGNHTDFTHDAACAPDLPKDAPLTALRQTLLDRAAALGHARTADPDLRVIAGGRTLRPKAVPGGLRFRLPKGASRVQIVSRSFIPDQMRAPDRDCRRLGVGVTSLRLDGRDMELAGDRLGAGWHAPEPGLRWTNGAAWLRTGVAHSLVLTVLDDVIYWAADEGVARAPAPGQAVYQGVAGCLLQDNRDSSWGGSGGGLARICAALLSALTSLTVRTFYCL